MIENGAAVLILKPRAIGDVLLMTPLLRALHRARPDVRLSVATSVSAAPLLESNPHLDAVLSFPETALSTLRFLGRVRRERYGAVVDAFGNPRTALVAALSGAPIRIGYDVRLRRFAYTHVIQRLGAGHYNARVQLELLRPLGIVSNDATPELFLRREERAAAARALGVRTGRTIVGLNPGGSWGSKRWFPVRWATLARRFAAREDVVVLWGPGEEAIADEVVALAGHPRVRKLPAGTLRQAAAAISHLRLLVTNDGAPKHIAVALGVRSLTLHGPTDPRAWDPGVAAHRVLIGRVPCAPCEKTVCGHKSCMVSLTVDAVHAAAK